MVGNAPCQGSPSLSPLPALSPGVLSYLQHCHPVSPHPAWLSRDAVRSWGCPLLITHRGAEAFIMGKALLPHSIPVASPVLRAWLCYLPSSRERRQPCSLPICRALLSRTGSLASAQGKVPFAAAWGTGSSREGQILIALVLALQTPKHQQLLLGQLQHRSCLQTLSCPMEVG